MVLVFLGSPSHAYGGVPFAVDKLLSMRASAFSPLSPAIALMRHRSWSAKLVLVGLPLVLSQTLCLLAAFAASPSGALIGGSMVLFGSAAYLSLALHASVRGGLRLLHSGLAAVSGGDLSHRIVLRGDDELAAIGAAVEGMNVRLSALVNDIRSSAVRVGMAGQLVANSSGSLALRTEQQAASLRGALERFQQLADAATDNAAAASQLERLTDQLKAEAERGGLAMSKAVEAMGGLETTSRQVGEIAAVIDGIAFQTNLLALNAAVEADNAGEAGRRFAVVATEVRQLALRSSDAASQMHRLMAQSGQQVENAVQQTRGIAQVLESLERGARNMSQSLRDIAEGDARQLSNLRVVTQTIGRLSEATKHNKAMVDKSAGAARDLAGHAAALSGAVASIRLREGSPDEARALVTKAISLVRSRGMAAAAEAFRDREGGLLDRDMYIFVIDRAGRYRIHGANPSMEGKRVHEVPGIDGERFLRDAWAVPAGGGWIEHDMVNPDSGAVQPRESFVVRIDDEQFIGCGVHRQAPAASASRGAAPGALRN